MIQPNQSELDDKLKERLYLACEKLHDGEHLGDDCMCTSEIAPAYKFMIEAMESYITANYTPNSEVADEMRVLIIQSIKECRSGSEAIGILRAKVAEWLGEEQTK